jgi:hypothetical protein
MEIFNYGCLLTVAFGQTRHSMYVYLPACMAAVVPLDIRAWTNTPSFLPLPKYSLA